MKVLLLLVAVAIGSIAGDYLEFLLATHPLKQDLERSKLNLGSDNLYIENVGDEKEFSMTYQMYLPNRGGPGDQSFRFPIKMKSPLPKIENKVGHHEDPIIED